MKTKTPCPVCHGKLGLFDCVKARTPSRVYCPHCKSRLQAQMRGLWLLVGVELCLLAGLGIVVVAQVGTLGRAWLPIGIAGYLIVAILVEFVVSLIIYTYGQLVPHT